MFSPMLAAHYAAGQTCIEAHPETHQNLIHHDKRTHAGAAFRAHAAIV
jgi:hypothetical protein